MTEPVPAGSGPGAAARLFGSALARGFGVFMVVSGSALAIGAGEYLATGRAYRPWTWIKVGWLYLLSFHRAGIRFFFGNAVSVVSDIPDGSGGGPYIYSVHFALLVGTGVAGYLLFRSARALAGRAGGSARRRALWGAAISIGYAIPIGLGASVATLEFPTIEASIRPVYWEAFALPLAFAAIVGAIGGLASSATVRGKAAWRLAAGGWRAFVVALGLALFGSLVLAGLRPDASGAYVRSLQGQGSFGVVAAGHHLLALPNQSVAILAVSMGSCDGIYGPRAGLDMACYGRLVHSDAIAFASLYLDERPPAPGALPFRAHGTPAIWLFFLAVPAAATFMGGRWAARGLGPVRAPAVGAASGVVFALLAGVGSRWAGITIHVAGATSGTLRLGPSLPRTFLLALAWGVIGGSIGALSVRQLEGEAEPAEPLEPPSATSV